MAFLHYVDPSIPGENRLAAVFSELSVHKDQIADLMAFLGPLKVKDAGTYEHSIRVGILAQKIAGAVHLQRKPLLYAGLLHDVGKALTDVTTLKKTEGWSERDSEEIAKHVMDGYDMIRGKFDFSAEIMLWHHKFQPKGYPKRLPKPLHDYFVGTKVLIPFYGRMLALADTFDAFHRVNDKHGTEPMTGATIKAKMLKSHHGLETMIESLYQQHIFTEEIYP